LTDHRIGLTLYKLSSIMDGALDEVIAALAAAHAQQQLEAIEAGL
jgi:peptide chain release factor 1